jgi:uncharacterized linocin/CFP29 family protein
MDAMIDFVYNGAGHGDVAQRLVANNMNVNSLRTNGILRADEWKLIDKAVIDSAKKRMNATADLMRRGLVLRGFNGLAKTVLEYNDVSDMTDASVSMDGVTAGKKDTLNFGTKFMPLPLIHKPFALSTRTLQASRESGAGIDTTLAEVASRKVTEASENMFFNGCSTVNFGGGSIVGVLTAPNRVTKTMTKAWTSCTGEEILADVLSMKQASLDKKKFGPWVLYIPASYETILDSEFKSATSMSIKERLLKITGIEDIKVSDYFSGNQVVLVQMDSSTVRLIEGLPITNVEWTSQGGMMYEFQVLSMLIPQVRGDQVGNCGIIHMATV